MLGLDILSYEADRDERDLFALYADPMGQPLFSERVPITSLAEFSDWLDGMLRESYHDFHVVRAHEGGELAGIVFSYDYHPFDLHCKVCVSLTRPWQDRGVAGRLGATFIDELFRAYPLRKVYALVYGYNERSLASNLQAGFEEEGCLQAYRYFDGAYHDCHILAMTRERFAERLARFSDLPPVGAASQAGRDDGSRA